jgi:hypothetical protein
MCCPAAPVAFLIPIVLMAQAPQTKAKPSLPPDQVAQTTRYLAALAMPMGGYAPAAGGKASLRATLGAVRGLRLLGVEPADMNACRDFVIGCLTPEGFADAPDQKPGPAAPALQAVGLMALHDLGAEKSPPVAEKMAAQFARLESLATEFESIRLAAAALEAGKRQTPSQPAWVQLIDKALASAPDDARLLGGATAARLRLGVKLKPEEQSALTTRLLAAQKEDGGWAKSTKDPSDLDSCYRVARAVKMLGAKPDSARLRAFIASCRNADGGYGVAKGQPSTVSATYQALIVLSWLE